MRIIVHCSPECMDLATIFIRPDLLYHTTNMMEATGRLIEANNVSGRPVWDDGEIYVFDIQLSREEIIKMLDSMPFVKRTGGASDR